MTGRRLPAAGALVTVAALLAAGVQTSPAAAQPLTAPPKKIVATPRPGAAQVELTPARRAALLQRASVSATATASALDLGSTEKLLVKDVVKDADGTVHTRYERTLAGLPVLGGDLVVHEGSDEETVTKATDAPLTVPTTKAGILADTAREAAVETAASEGVQKAKVEEAPRLVVWAATGRPALAWEAVATGLQDDGTPSALHVVTDARTGEALSQFETIATGTGHGRYNGTVPIGTTQSGDTYELTDNTRGGHKTYDLAHGVTDDGALYTDDDDVWGDGTNTDGQTAAVDAAFGAQETWDFYQDAFGRNGIRNDGVAAHTNVHYGTNYANAFWDDGCFCMTYGDGANNAKPLTSLDVAGHEMTHGVTSVTAGLVYSGESGGLNEATSDIMGTATEFHADNPADVPD